MVQHAWLQWLCRFGTTQKPAECDWKKALADERTDPVEAPVGPNTKRANESQEPTPTETSSSPGPAALMPTKLSERADGFTDGVGTTRTENAKERGQARRQQVNSMEDQW